MMNRAQIHIIEPSGVRRSRPISSRSLVIGRDPECDVIINDERASRKHAQITFDGRYYYVTDLNSTNGVLLGKTPLVPNTPTPWRPDLPLRIGDIYFNLELPVDAPSQRQEELGAMETMAGYIPEEKKKEDNTLKYLLWGGAGMLVLCACIGALGVVLYFFI
jgi:predicted component of type VI protein secretion system